MKQTFKASTKPVRIIFKNLQKNHLTDKIMHFFAALLFKIFGWRLYRPLHLTTVSQVFEMVPWTGWRKILIGSLIFVLPVAFGLALLIIYRFPQIDHSLSVTIFLFIAALWSIAGPILIWQYEVRTLDIFDRKCHNYFSNDATYRQIRNFIYQPVLELKPCKIIVVIWMGISIISFFQVQGSVYRFAFFGPTDFLWILLFIGIILYSYYSSLGFCFIYKTVFLCRKLSSFLQVADFHNQRKSFGLGFVGDFSRSTCIPFLSGWLIVPLVFFSYLEEDSQNNFFPLGAILLYSLVAFLVVYYPVIIVRNKIRECKSQVIIDLYSDLYEKSVEFEKIKKLSNFLIIIILKLN